MPKASPAVSSAKEIKARNQKILELPSGLKVLIRKLSPVDFAKFGEVPIADGLLPKEDTGQDEPIATKLPPEIQKARMEQGGRWSEQVAVNGVVKPRVVPEGTDAGEDDLHPSDFGDELTLLVEGILDFSGLLDEEDNPFRKGEPGGATGGRDG